MHRLFGGGDAGAHWPRFGSKVILRRVRARLIGFNALSFVISRWDHYNGESLGPEVDRSP
jgi:hypothetical protein